ncbi:hypothetical protein HOY80DRAFT_945611 [Tuber brumale]|nr:hypothetical protein HOY80DRAFT_945611 [Tuber brumale]
MDRNSTSPGAQTSCRITSNQSLAQFAHSGSQSEGTQENTSLVGGMPQPTLGIRGAALTWGRWLPVVALLYYRLAFLFNVMFGARQQDNPERPASPPPETLPPHVSFGDKNRNPRGINKSYNTTNYSGNAKNFGQGGTVNLKGATVH